MLTVAVGAKFDIELDPAAADGGIWELPSLPGGVKLVATRFPEKMTVDAGGMQVFELQADEPGHLQLRFELKRRWQPTPIQSRLIEIDVL